MKVKGIELFKMISNRELKQGTKIKFDNMIFLYDYPNLSGIYRIGTDTSARNNLFYFLDCSNISKDFEILEDKTEEIEEIQNFTCLTKGNNGEIIKLLNELSICYGEKLNELARAINQIKKDFLAIGVDYGNDCDKETNCMTD